MSAGSAYTEKAVIERNSLTAWGSASASVGNVMMRLCLAETRSDGLTMRDYGSLAALIHWDVGNGWKIMIRGRLQFVYVLSYITVHYGETKYKGIAKPDSIDQSQAINSPFNTTAQIMRWNSCCVGQQNHLYLSTDQDYPICKLVL